MENHTWNSKKQWEFYFMLIRTSHLVFNNNNLHSRCPLNHSARKLHKRIHLLHEFQACQKKRQKFILSFPLKKKTYIRISRFKLFKSTDYAVITFVPRLCISGRIYDFLLLSFMFKNY